MPPRVDLFHTMVSFVMNTFFKYSRAVNTTFLKFEQVPEINPYHGNPCKKSNKIRLNYIKMSKNAYLKVFDNDTIRHCI